MDLLHKQTIRAAKSMEAFADGDETFIIGEWREWRDACFASGTMLPPSDFKKVPRMPQSQSLNPEKIAKAKASILTMLCPPGDNIYTDKVVTP